MIAGMIVAVLALFLIGGTLLLDAVELMDYVVGIGFIVAGCILAGGLIMIGWFEYQDHKKNPN